MIVTAKVNATARRLYDAFHKEARVGEPIPFDRMDRDAQRCWYAEAGAICGGTHLLEARVQKGTIGIASDGPTSADLDALASIMWEATWPDGTTRDIESATTWAEATAHDPALRESGRGCALAMWEPRIDPHNRGFDR